MRSQCVMRFRRVAEVVPALLNISHVLVLFPPAEVGVVRRALHAGVRHVGRAQIIEGLSNGLALARGSQKVLSEKLALDESLIFVRKLDDVHRQLGI